MPDDTFRFRAFTRLQQLKYLLSTGQIDPSSFQWTEAPRALSQPGSVR